MKSRLCIDQNLIEAVTIDPEKQAVLSSLSMFLTNVVLIEYGYLLVFHRMWKMGKDGL